MDSPNEGHPSAKMPNSGGTFGDAFTEWIPMSSSNVGMVRYDGESNVLEVAFRNGSVYQYLGVPLHVFENFIGSGSPGRYVHTILKVRFTATQVR